MSDDARSIDLASASLPASSSPARAFGFSRGELAFFVGVVVVGLALRWIGLDVRPVFHDESLHAMYGKYFFDQPQFHFYRYDPMLHGPMIYNVYRAVYSTFGDTTWAARFPMALMGSALIFVPLLFRRWLSNGALLALVTGIALSPTLIFWSRFAREDYYVVTGLVLMLYGATLAHPRWRPMWVLLGLAVQLCTKENFFVHVAMIAAYLVYEFGCSLFFNNEDDPPPLFVRLFEYLGRHWIDVVFGAIPALCMFLYLYSAGGRHWSGPLDAFTKSVSYWYHHHDIERIKGPFLFHFYILSWYEIVFTVALLVYFVRFYATRGVGYAAFGGGILMLWLLIYTIGDSFKLHESFPFTEVKAKDWRDCCASIFLLAHSLIVTTTHLKERRPQLAWWGYFFTANFFSYSMLGEKVPWLSMYVLLPGIVYLVLYFEDDLRTWTLRDTYREFPVMSTLGTIAAVLMILGILFILEDVTIWRPDAKAWADALQDSAKENCLFLLSGLLLALLTFANSHFKWATSHNLKHFAVAFGLIVTLRSAIQTNYVYAGHSSEYLSQVHTTPEFDQIALSLRKEAETPLRGGKPEIVAIGDAVWPITWYLRDIPEYRFSASSEERRRVKYIIQDWSEPAKDVPEGFSYRRITLRGWFVPDYNQMSFKRFLNYSLNHTPWNEPGYSYVWLMVNDKL